VKVLEINTCIITINIIGSIFLDNVHSSEKKRNNEEFNFEVILEEGGIQSPDHLDMSILYDIGYGRQYSKCSRIPCFLLDNHGPII
jgi:hypothetical protein